MARRVVVCLVLSLLLSISPSRAFAQAAALTGVVVDAAGAAVVGAAVVIRSGPRTAAQTTTDAHGAFALTAPSGTYTLVVDANAFTRSTSTVVIGTFPAAPTRVILQAAGYSETVVVTAARAESRRDETPQKIEVVGEADLARSVAADLTDVLKKNAGVDVVQYNSTLSGVGIRGFRPQFSGVNKRSLLLIDGRPSGVTNLATLRLDDVDRVEVLKGSASALYGSSAMGGVVNVITRDSRGPIAGGARVGGGSFGTTDLGVHAGGNATSRVDFDASASAVDQRHDIRMGNGVVRPATSFRSYTSAGRLGVDLSRGWRLDGGGDLYRGRDIDTPPDIAAGIVGEGRKNLEHGAGHARVSGAIGAHALSFTGYGASEAGHQFNVTTSNPADLPYVPYLSFESDLRWAGVQARDEWRVSSWQRLVFGLDYENVKSVTRSYARTGDRVAPFSADSDKRTAGTYAEDTITAAHGRTVITVGGRLDRIATETLATPLKTNFTPSEATFDVFNPSVGLSQRLATGVRLHATAGRGFIPAEASMLTGFTTSTVGGRTQISQGNPALKPERSDAFDAGFEWTSTSRRVDVTAFRTVTHDEFVSNVVISNPPPPDPIVVSVQNGLGAHISGLDLEVEQRVGARVGVFGNSTHYFTREERLASGGTQDILNVARNTIRAGVDLDLGRVSARLSGRYVQGRKDNDFNAPGFPIIGYMDFTVFDATVTYRLAPKHAIELAVGNVFDAFYYEKLGYPLPGTSFSVSYRWGF